ncbi:MAG TPA: hypothetical protein PLP23_14755 [Panacibacter sp.]|nr:hypothetical protein [Panacibacter sp.]
MNTKETEIINEAIREIENPAFNITKQYLAIHKVVYTDGLPKIERVAIEENDNSAIVYFSIEDEKFYLAVFLTESHVKVRFINMEGFYYVSLMALSEILDYSQLCSLTVLNPVSGFNKGDVRPFGRLLYKYSGIKFHPNPEPDNF